MMNERERPYFENDEPTELHKPTLQFKKDGLLIRFKKRDIRSHWQMHRTEVDPHSGQADFPEWILPIVTTHIWITEESRQKIETNKSYYFGIRLIQQDDPTILPQVLRHLQTYKSEHPLEVDQARLLEEAISVLGVIIENEDKLEDKSKNKLSLVVNSLRKIFRR